MRSLIVTALIAIAACGGSPPPKTGSKIQGISFGQANDPWQLTPGNNNNLNISGYNGTGRYWFIGDNDGTSKITGILVANPDVDGDFFYMCNRGTAPFLVMNNSPSSSVGAKIFTRTGNDIVLQTGDCLFMDWDLRSNRWTTIQDPMRALVSVTTPTRSFNTPFCPSTSRDIIGTYTVRISSGLTLTTGARGCVELRSDASPTPTTVRARVCGGNTGTLTIGLNTNDVTESPLNYRISARDCAVLATVTEVGTPTYSISAQTEQALD